jgi:hypothetical protein
MHAEDDDTVLVGGPKHSPDRSGGGQGPKLRKEPKEDVNVGCINPYALVEAILGQRIDIRSPASIQLVSDILQTDYEELFDMKFDSILYAGLKLSNSGSAKALKKEDMKFLSGKDLQTADLSVVKTLRDLEKLGLDDVLKARVKRIRIQNDKVRVVLYAGHLATTLSNCAVTNNIADIALPFRNKNGSFSPPNCSWQDKHPTTPSMRDMMENFMGRPEMQRNMGGNFPLMGNRMTGAAPDGLTEHNFDDPVQGAMGNSYLIAALFSVFWADPTIINRSQHFRSGGDDRRSGGDERRSSQKLAIKFFDKGGHNNAKTTTIEVGYDLVVNNSNYELVYCRASDRHSVWPALYEKAFAKWISDSSSDHPDITQTHHGDPVKAMAQMNDKKPCYLYTEEAEPSELIGLVRANSLGYKTITPMVAWTKATGNAFSGSNLVANHAYSVLGWTDRCGDTPCVVLRNPWGQTEPAGRASYPGLIDRVELAVWPPASLLDAGGVIALEMSAFRRHFECLGMTQ